MDDVQFKKLLTHLNLSWKGYRRVRKGVKKRIRRHMHTLECPDIDAYLSLISDIPQHRREMLRLMTVSISRFFRDRIVWDGLKNVFLPDLLIDFEGNFKVWSAGCSGGEEPYSFLMVWDSLSCELTRSVTLSILATDINPASLERAQKGIFPASSLKEMSEKEKATHFETRKGGRRYVIAEHHRHRVTWQLHQLLEDPPQMMFHIILLRNNLLTYYNDPLKQHALKKIVDTLAPGGLLVTGSHEKIPDEFHMLKRTLKFPHIYKKCG